MDTDKFVNRTDELKDFISRITTPRDDPLALFVIAPSGIGKSRFMAEAGRRTDILEFLRVRVRRSRGSRFENGFFLLQTAAALHKASQTIENLPSLVDFNKNLTKYIDTENTGIDVAEEALKELDMPMINTIKGFVERRMSIGSFNPKELLGPNEAAGIAYLKKYVRAILEQNRIGLILENAHLIDENTLAFFSETIDWPKETVLVNEFTSLEGGGSNTWSLGELAEEYERSGFNISTMALTPLEYSHYSEVASNKGIEANEDLEETYSREGGNIRAIYNVATIKNYNPNAIIDENSARIVLKSVSRDERFLLVAIFNHDSAIPVNIMEKFHIAVDHRMGLSGTTRKALHSLLLEELVSIENDHVALAHDNLAHAVQESDYPALETLARDIWIKIYKSIDFKDIDWVHFLDLIIKQGDASIIGDVLSQFLEQARTAHFRDRLIEILCKAARDFQDRILQNPSDLEMSVLQRIVHILFELEEFEEIEALVEMVELPAIQKQLLNCMLLDRLDKPEDAINGAMEMFNAAATPDADRVGFALVAIASLASLHRRKEAYSLYKKCLATSGTTNSLYYPYLMRITDIFLGLNESLLPIRRSIETFQMLGNTIEEAHSRNALGMQLARLGHLDEASEQLKAADQALANSSVDQAQVLNNRAVIRIMNHWCDETTRMYLSMARDLVRRPFDKIVVSQNMALFSALIGDENAEELFEIAEHNLKEFQLPDKGLYRSYYWNKSYWQKLQGMENEANETLLKASSLDIKHTPIWVHRLNNTKLTDNDYAFQATLPFHAAFLSKWHFPIEFA